MNLPNQLTCLRIILTPVIALLLFQSNPVLTALSFLIFTLGSLTDWYDGYTARKYGYVSTWGEFLDPLADKIFVSVMLLCFSFLGYFPLWMVLVIIMRDILITILRSYAIFRKEPVVTSRLAKLKTFIQMGVLYIVFLFHVWLRIFPDGIIRPIHDFIVNYKIYTALMLLITAFTLITGVYYLVANRGQVRRFGQDMVQRIHSAGTS